MSVSFASIGALAIAISFCYAAALVFYRLVLHPLRSFPGPRLAAATYWYECYHDLFAGSFPGQGVYNIERLHDRYGPIVRISPDELSVKDPDWFDVLYKSGRRDKWHKNSKANGSPGSVASTIDHPTHRARRATLNPFFSKRAVDSLSNIVESKVEQLSSGIEHQSRQTGRVLDIGIAFTALTLDVISDYCFGQSWRCLAAPDFAPEWKRTMTNLFEPVPVVKQFPWIVQIMSSLPRTVLAKMAPDMALFQGAKDNVQKQVERIIAEYEDRGTTGEKNSTGQLIKGDGEPSPARTIFHTVLDSNLPPVEKTVDRITDEAFVMVVAGGETTAKTLTNAVYHILANSEWYKRVVTELDQIMPDPSVLAPYTQLEQLPTLTAAIKETLRISAPVTNRVQVLDPENELMYKQWVIPRGSPVSMNIPGIHLDPAIFPNPHVFNPARWIGDNEDVKRANSLSYAELYMGLAAVLRRFELELYDTVRERDVDVVRDCFVGMPSPQAKGVRVRVVAKRP